MRFYLTTVLLVVFFSCEAQEERTQYVSKVMSICPDAEIIEVESKDEYVEIEYVCGNEVFEIGLDTDLRIIFSESEISLDDKTHQKISDKLDKKYVGWKTDEFILVELQDTSFYKAEILRNGVEENVYFTLDGKYYKAKNLALDASWNITSLEKNTLYNTSGYSLTIPDRTFELPGILIEISGISVINDTVLLGVQDEAGIVFRYNLQKEELSKMYRFTGDGDFEDITVRGDTIAVLRSDGTLFSLNYKDYSGESDSRVLPINCMNMEGLFYDNPQKRFLVACKEPLVNKPASLRYIFSVGVNSSERPEKEFVIDLQEINTFLREHYHGIGTNLITFNPSAVSVHPLTGDIYVLSASDRLLAVYRNKQLTAIYPLAEELFYKPEGISFNKNGDLYISSEGDKKGYAGGQIHYFTFRK